MRHLAALVILTICWSASGCATALQGVALIGGAQPAARQTTLSDFGRVVQNYSPVGSGQVATATSGAAQVLAPYDDSSAADADAMPITMAGDEPNRLAPVAPMPPELPLGQHAAPTELADVAPPCNDLLDEGGRSALDDTEPAPIAPGPEALASTSGDEDSLPGEIAPLPDELAPAAPRSLLPQREVVLATDAVAARSNAELGIDGVVAGQYEHPAYPDVAAEPEAPDAPGPDALGLAGDEPPIERNVAPQTSQTAQPHHNAPADATASAQLPPVPKVGSSAPAGTFVDEAQVHVSDADEYSPQDSAIPLLADPRYMTANQGEVVPSPAPVPTSPFKSGGEDEDADRFGRHLSDVMLDIRPTEGVMPTDVAAEIFEQQAITDPRQTHEGPGILCSYTPWTICFRPLYFEEVALERYGEKRRFLQPAASGVQFLKNIALLPYKMRVRPPRSCVCSNGFSRIGDCPPPGYGECVWRWDAAIIEAAAVTGFVFILP